MKVALLQGGRSLERGVSLRSGQRVAEALVDLGHEVDVMDLGPDLVSRLDSNRPDVVFIALHGTEGEDGTVSSSTRPWEPEGLQRVQALVAAAVGLDQTRGDQLTVENIPFGVTPTEAPVPVGVGVQALDLLKEHWRSIVNTIAVLLGAAFAFFGVLRPRAARRGRGSDQPALPAPAAAGARLPTVSEMEGQLAAELDPMGPATPRRVPVLTQRVARLAADEPEQVARIVRGWISEDGR